MKVSFYRLTCLTNLHMGSGETNYNIIDLEVERDPVLQQPTMNSSGVKGALRDACEAAAGADAEKNKRITAIFGSKENGDVPGAYRFFCGDLLARPVRISGGNGSYILATTPDLINHFLRKLKAFGLDDNYAEVSPCQSDCVITGINCSQVEGYTTKKQKNETISNLLNTDNWALMHEDILKSIDLPVMAHNVLSDGKSKNLWYEEVVPHESIFGLLIGRPDEDDNLWNLLSGDDNSKIVQFGAGASTGNGFVKMEKAGEKNEK